jgi:fused signal recognition particle receptor
LRAGVHALRQPMFEFFRKKRAPEPAPATAPAEVPPPGDDAADAGAHGMPAAAALAEAGLPGAAEVGLTPIATEALTEEPGVADQAFAPSADVAAAAAGSAGVPQTGAPAIDAAAGSSAPRSWRERLKAGLGLSRTKLAGALTGVFRRPTLDEEALESLESALLEADVGVDATQYLNDDLRERYRRAGPDADPRAVLREALVALLAPLEQPLVIGAQRPFVIMLAGVNGAGKTTSIGKLAKWLREQGLTVLLAAGDTFRAAAREQLAAWGERNGVTVIQQQGGDPAAVVFDAVGAAKARGIDVVLADTAGRLATQAHLMDELRKVKRVTGKAREGAPDAILLVLDANTGQNGVAQVKAFDSAVGLTGLVVTKLDGSAKGGVVAAIARQHPVPLQFIGVGEGMDDLRPFAAREFVEALLPSGEES